MIEVRHLRYFVAVAEELHFGRAAGRLHMAQSPLSHQIRQLERRLGVVLIERDHHVVGLTDAGRTFLEEARGLLSRIDEAVDRTKRAGRGELGLVSVGFVPEMTTDLVPLSLRRHRETFPDVAIQLSQANTGVLLDALRQRQIDVGFVRAPAGPDDLEYEELVREPLVLANPANGEPVKSLQDLADSVVVAPSYQAARGLRRDIDTALALAGVVPSTLREAPGAVAALLLVAAGTGTALVPASTVRHHPVPGVTITKLEEAPTTGAGMCWRRREASRVVLGFIETARASAGEDGIGCHGRLDDREHPDEARRAPPAAAG